MIDYIIVCDFLLNYLEQMYIDEPRKHVLTKYLKRSKTASDHNILYAKFAIICSSRVPKVTPLGEDYFRIAILLWESLFLSSIITNSDIWYGLRKEEVQQLEDLDLILL